MPTMQCVNFEINTQMCPCTSTDCSNWGICCLCTANHVQGGSLTACVRTPRPAATLELRGILECANQVHNQEVCVCGSADCGRRGICCECLRNHWKEDGQGRPSCLQGG